MMRRRVQGSLPRLGALALAAVTVCDQHGWAQSLQVGASAQGDQPPLQVVPAASISLTHLSNGGVLAPVGVAAVQASETVAQLSPSLTVLARSAALKGSLRYTATALQYEQAQEANRVVHNLNTAASWAVAEDYLTVDAAATRGEQARSAFGAPVQGLIVPSANRVQVTNANVSPQFKARLLQEAALTLRYTYSVSESSSQALVPAGQSATPGLGRLSTGTLDIGLSGGSRLRWNLRAQDTSRSYSLGRPIESRSVDAALNLAVDADLRLSAGLGQEENNVFATSLQRYDTWTVGANWTPTPRTELDAQYSNRFFGNGHRVALQHRMATVLVRLADTRQVSNQLGGGFANPGEPVTLLEALLRSNALAGAGGAGSGLSREAQILDGLRRAGIDPSQSVSPGSLNATPSAVRSQELFLGYAGPRLSLAATAFARDTQRLGSPLNPFEDLALVPRFKQQGATASAGWRLTPSSQIALALNHIRTPAGGNLPAVQQQSVGLNLSNSIGRKTTLNLSLQQLEFTSQSRGLSTKRQSQVAAIELNMRF